MAGVWIAAALFLATRAPSQSAAPVDPARLAAARTLVEVLQTERQVRAQSAKNDAGATFDRLVPVQAALRAQLTDAPGFAKAREQAIAILTQGHDQTAAATIPLIIDADIRRYAEHFSLTELSQLVDFYRSPLGQRLIAEQPGMAADGQRFQATVLQPIVTAQNAAISQRLTPILTAIVRSAGTPAAPATAK